MILYSGQSAPYNPMLDDTWVLSNAVPRDFGLQLSIDHGGNVGTVTLTIYGKEFVAGDTVRLTASGQPDIIGSNVTVSASGATLTATFDFRGTIPGEYKVVIPKVNGATLTVPKPFTIEQGGAVDVRVYKIGTPAVPGRNVTYYIMVQNFGNLDSDSLSMSEYLEPWFTFISANPIPTNIVQSSDSFPASAIGQQYDSFLEWTIPSVPAGTTQIYSYTVTLDASFTPGNIVSGRVCIGNMVLGSADCRDDLISCLGRVLRACAVCRAGPGTPACQACVLAGTYICEALWVNCMSGAGSCANNEQPVRGSIDPNDMIGPTGNGAQRWISGAELMPYVIMFENLPTATKSATDVIIKDSLDISKFDLSTLTIGSINFGSSVYTPPSPSIPLSIAPLSADIDLRPQQNLIVRITANLNSSTGIVTIKLASIDPATNTTPENPLIGFLAPGVGGNMFFSVKPKNNLTTGDVIDNKAAIVFDSNAPIDTPIWSNKIDNTKPISHVIALADSQQNPNFTVNWMGTDQGSGIKDFKVYVSDNYGPYSEWQFDSNEDSTSCPSCNGGTNTTSKIWASVTNGIYHGASGHTYRFYSIARDLTGNIENSKTEAEATTKVVSDNIPPTTISAPEPLANTNGWNKTDVSITLSSTDNDGGSGVKQIQYSLSGSQILETQTISGSTANVTISTEGTTTLTYFATDNAGNIEQSKTLTVKIDKTPPVISGMPATGYTLWPPNHKMNLVATVSASDSLSGLASDSFNVTGTSNETFDLKNPDILITSNASHGFVIQLRSERAGNGTGRVYMLIATASDIVGNTTTSTATCTVPHDQGN